VSVRRSKREKAKPPGRETRRNKKEEAALEKQKQAIDGRRCKGLQKKVQANQDQPKIYIRHGGGELAMAEEVLSE
jgi:hypothetical protein